MKIAVLNYPVGDVDILDAPDDLQTSEEIECWLVANYTYRMSDIYYMADVKNVNIGISKQQIIRK